MSHKIRLSATELASGTPDGTKFLRDDLSWVTPSGSPSAIPVGNTVFVSKDGNDGTGTRERLDLPFLTISAAEAAATAGDTVVVFPGNYEEAAKINLDNTINFHFIGQGEVTLNTGVTDAIFEDNDATTPATIFAPGWTFRGRGNQQVLLHLGLNIITIIAKELLAEDVPPIDSFSSGTLNIKAQRIASTDSSFSVINLSQTASCTVYADVIEAVVTGEVISIVDCPYVNITARRITGNSAGGDYTIALAASNLGDQIFITADEIEANTGWAATLIGDSDTIYINARTIRASGTCTVTSEAAMTYVRADEIINNRDASTYGNIHGEGGNMTCIGARLVREGSGGGAAIKTSLGGTVKLIAVAYDHNSIDEDVAGAITRIDDQFESGIWVDGVTAFIGDLSPAQLTADVDDYNPTGLTRANVLRLSSDASRALNGLQGGEDGRVLFIHNVGSNPITIPNDAGTSTAANRFFVSSTVTLNGNQSAMIQYDSTSSRWRVLSISGTGGSYTDEEAQDAVGNNFVDTDTIDAVYVDATPAFSWNARLQMSLTSDASGIKLVNDETSPGNREFYATSDVGTKGWRPVVVADIADYVGNMFYLVAASDAPQLIKDRADYVCDGTADDVEINAALALGNVQLSQGTFAIAATIDMPTNRWLRGVGDGTLLNSGGGGLNVISETAATGGVKITDLRIDGVTNTGRGIYMTSVGSGTGASAVTGCVIENVYITRTDFGIELELCANCIINKVRTVDLDFDGIVLDRTVRTVVSSTEHFGNFAGIFVTGTATKSTHLSIYGNICEGMGDMGIQSENCTDSVFANNVIRTTVNQGLDFQNCESILAVGNFIDGAQDQPGFNTSTVPNSLFIGNTIQNCNSDGMVISGCTSTTVTGNNIFNCGLGTNNTFDAVSIFSDDVNFVGNTIKRGTGNQHRYGLRINGANRCLIADNDLYQSGATGDINDTGTNTRKRNNKANDGTWLDILITNYQLNMSTARILGRTTASTGAIEEITVAAPLTLSAGTLDFDETATLGNNARVAVSKNSGAVVGTRREINFIEGSNITLTIADDAGNEEVDVTIASTGGSATVPVGNTVYVTKDGNDGTGARERLDLPFLTISAAITAATAGDKIIVHPGTYTETLTLKDDVNIYLMDGVIVQTTTEVSTITDNNVAVTCVIDGYGIIRGTGTTTAYNTVDILNTGTDLTIFARLIHSEFRGVEARGTLKIYADILTNNTNAQECIRMNGNLCHLTYEGNAEATGGYVIMASSSPEYTNTAKIRANLRTTLNSPLAVYGAVVDFEGTTYSTSYFGLEIAGGRFFARNSTFQSIDTTAAEGHAFVEYGVDDGANSTIQFESCIFLAGPNSDSINKMSGASGQQISFLTPCYANRPIDTSGVTPNIVFGRENLNILGTHIGHAQLNTSSKVVPAQLAVGTITDGYVIKSNAGVPTWEPDDLGSGGGYTVHEIDNTDSPYTISETTGEIAILADASGGAITVNLPTAVGNTAKYHIKSTVISANNVTVDPAGTETVDGGSTAVIQSATQASVTLINNNANWFVI